MLSTFTLRYHRYACQVVGTTILVSWFVLQEKPCEQRSVMVDFLEVADPLSVAFGARIREVRIIKGLSQDELALRSGLHRTFIGRLERGETNMTAKTLYRIALGLDILMAELLPTEYEKLEALRRNHPSRKRRSAQGRAT
jgi:ribosome-binding protein aMBF1 (putative translation factor)